jgi:hypothetical protein
MTNVLHHLARPMDFFMEALPKLQVGGKIVLTEPYFTPLSRPIYRFLHHEPVDFNVEKPELDVGEGPLSSSNQALPYLMFQQREDWKRCLEKHYILDEPQVFTGLSYFATGGISRQLPFPPALYKIALSLDDQLARRLPSLWGSFFIQSCTKR